MCDRLSDNAWSLQIAVPLQTLNASPQRVCSHYNRFYQLELQIVVYMTF